MSGEVFQPIKSWKSSKGIALCLGCDVGGSGLRVRLSNFYNPSQFIDVGHMKAQTTNDALHALNKMKKTMESEIGSFKCNGAAIAVAGPISKGTVVLTNWLGKPSVRTLSLNQLPEALFPRGKSLFLNDLEAGSYGIIAAHDSKILEKHFTSLWPDSCPQGPMVSDTRTAVMAMGSGLGVGIILKTPLLSKPLVVSTELGHLQIPAVGSRHPNAKNEYAMIQHVSDHYYGGSQAPEYEDFASGRGLSLLYQFYNFKQTGTKIPLDQIEAGEVATMAKNGDKVAKEALLNHYLIFMRAAKSVATTLSCDSVLLSLDNQVKNDWFVRAAADDLKDEFYHFIRPDWMKGIRVYGQVKAMNFNILGTDYMAHTIAHK